MPGNSSASLLEGRCLLEKLRIKGRTHQILCEARDSIWMSHVKCKDFKFELHSKFNQLSKKFNYLLNAKNFIKVPGRMKSLTKLASFHSQLKQV